MADEIYANYENDQAGWLCWDHKIQMDEIIRKEFDKGGNDANPLWVIAGLMAEMAENQKVHTQVMVDVGNMLRGMLSRD